jgi:hypothetical protein
LTVPIAGPAYQGLSRTIQIPACVLSIEDLRKLFIDLDALTREVTSAQIDRLQQPANTTAVDFNHLKEQAKREAGLNMFVQGKNGEQVVLHSAAAITREILPDALLAITFDSAPRFNMQLNYDPLNRFRLVLDFRGPGSVISYDPWNYPTPNESSFTIVGNDQTWVAGVNEMVLSFLKARKRSRRWLHGPIMFTLGNWLVGFPAAFWLIYRLNGATQGLLAGLPAALRGGVYIYVFITLLLIFRTLVHVLRWLFPIIELEGSRSKAIRTTISAVELGLLSALIYDVLKAAIN